MQSTKLESIAYCMLLVLFLACTKDGGGNEEPEPTKTPTQAPEETPAEMARRLRPRIERAEPGSESQDIHPLLRIDSNLPIRTRLVLWSPRGESLPTSKQEKALEGLGRPLWNIVHENLLSLMQTDPKPTGDVFSGEVDGQPVPLGLQVQMDRPGLETLVLVPRFWDNLVARFEKPLVAALPDRQHLLFLVDDPTLLEKHRSQCREWFEQASEPLCDRFLRWDPDQQRLLPGPRFVD